MGYIISKINLPIYEIFIDEKDDIGIEYISLVEKPAIGIKGVYFKDENSEYKKFKIIEEKVIVAPALIPDIKIYRKDDIYGEYYVYFSRDTIKRLVEKFNYSGDNRRINIEHEGDIIDAFIMEDWIIESDIHDKSKIYGFNLPIGTYMLKIKINDDKIWEYIKNNEKYGLSVEGYFMQKLNCFNDSKKIDLKKDLRSFIDNLDLNDIKDFLNKNN